MKRFLDDIKKLFTKHPRLWTAVLIFHLLAAFLSQGHRHPDEHFQILEFLNFKLGGTPADDLPWEFRAQMRSFLMPFIYFIQVKLLPISDPFSLAFFFRLQSCFWGLWSLLLGALWISHSQWEIHEKTRNKIIFLFCLLWFFPFIHARISSEALSGSIFSIGFFLYFLKEHYPALDKPFGLRLIGFILGMSVIIRFQLGFAIAPFVLWIVLVERKTKNAFCILTGILIFFLVNLLIDHWGYGQWTIPAYNYFFENILLKKSYSYGVSPWYTYFNDIFQRGGWPIGLVILLSCFYFFWKRPKDSITWMMLPFFVVHSMVAHKEGRFLYPMVPFLPAVIGLCWARWEQWAPRLQWITKVCLGLNLLLLPYASTVTVNNLYPVIKYIQKNSHQISTLYFIDDRSPFGSYILNYHFWDSFRPQLISLHKSINIDPLYWANRSFYVYVEIAEDYFSLTKREDCHPVFSSPPTTIYQFLRSKTKFRISIKAIFLCTKKD
jgi:GPI mannosyltransferase 3